MTTTDVQTAQTTQHRFAERIEVLDHASGNLPVHVPVPGQVLVDGRRLPGILGVGGVHVTGEPGNVMWVTLLVQPGALEYEKVTDTDGQPVLTTDGHERRRVAINGQEFLTPRHVPRPRPWHENHYGADPCLEVDVFCEELRFRSMTAYEATQHTLAVSGAARH